MRHRHRPAHARRRLWLYRLDHHLADLRLLHLHLLRDRGGDSRLGAGDVLRHSAPDRLSHQRGRDHSAGDARHHADQPLPAVDAAGLDRAAHLAVRRDRLGQSAFVRGVDEIRRRAWQSRRPSRSAAVRRGRFRGVLAGGADRRAGRLPALPAARPPHHIAQGVVDRDAQRGPGLDRARLAEAAGGLVPRLFRARCMASRPSTPPSPPACISKPSATCCRSRISRWR